MAGTDGYNGWFNWDTWNTNLWLSNEEGTYRYWVRQAGHIAGRHFISEKDEAVRELADQMQAEVPDSGAVGDEVDWAEVDWTEIAETWLEDDGDFLTEEEETEDETEE